MSSFFRSIHTPSGFWALIIGMTLILGLQGCLNSTANNPRATPEITKAPTTPSSQTDSSGSTTTEPVTGIKHLGVGNNYSCAIKKLDNSLWCWGESSNYQLGNGGTTDQSAPAPVALSQKWNQIEGGSDNTCALDDKNNLYCWGVNNNGEAGINKTGAVALPTLIKLSGADAVWNSISLGQNHTCAILNDSSLWCWGDNTYNQLGLGAAGGAQALVPTQVQTATDWTMISANGDHTCGIRHVSAGGGLFNETLWCWGKNDKGQLGLGDLANNHNAPTQVGADTDWAAVSTGGTHTCAIKTTGTLWCWGDNSFGQLGNGTTAQKLAPFQVAGATWSSLSAGGYHTCAIKTDNTLWCWGNGTYGQLGVNVASHAASPQQVVSSAGVKRVASGEYHTCAINSSDRIYCWGLNGQGQLGIGSLVNTDAPTNISPLSWKQIDSGATHSCGILDDTNLGDKIYCSGLNEYGQLGDGTTQSRAALISNLKLSPVPTWKQVSSGDYHTCAIKSDGTLWCWGKNDDGRLGYTRVNIFDDWSPGQEATLAVNWLQVSAGGDHTCAIKTDHSLYCWGNNTNGQLGNNVIGGSVATPTREFTGDSTWSFVSAGNAHTCAIRTDNTLWCWGKNNIGQVGDNTTVDKPVPTQVCLDVGCSHATDWQKIAAGGQHTCGMRQDIASGDRTIWCWGSNATGQLGQGSANTHPDSPIPTQEGGKFKDWADVAAGDTHTCAILQSASAPDLKSVFCWGDNTYGQVGTNKNPQYTPDTVGSYGDWQAPSIANTPYLSLGKQTSCGFRGTTTSKKLYCWGEGAELQLGDGRGFKTTPQLLSLN